ncbi:MAG TPA: EamA family transporter [Pyrinomonadaceae bacterium]|jgi:drug/metabolite transporter (DMT)-like permease
MANKEKLAAYAALAAVWFFWGTTYLAIRVGLDGLPPMLLAGIRFTVAGSVLFLLMYRQQGARLPIGREWLNLSIVGVLLLVVGNGAVVWAEQWIPSGMAALLVATSPFWVAGFERMSRDGERIGARVLVGMLVGFGGLALLVAPEIFGARLDAYYILGIVGLQIACASWSGGSVYAKHHPAGVAPLMSAAVQMLVAGVVMTIMGTLTGEWSAMRPTPKSLGALLYLIVFGSIVAYSAYTYVVHKLPLSIVSTYSYVNPVIAVLLGWLILSEPLGWRVAAATAIILSGVALVKTSPKEIWTAVRRLRQGKNGKETVLGATSASAR